MEENVIGRPGVLNELPRLRTAEAHDVFDLSDPVDQDEEDNVGTQFRQASSQRSRLTTHLGCGILMADGYSYRKDRVLKRRIGYSAYRCVERKCPATSNWQHLMQLEKRIQKCNDLLKRYQTVDEDRIIMKSLANLAFVPTHKVYEAFCALWDEASDMDPLFRSFFRTYIGKDSVPDELIPEFTAGCGADAFIRDQLPTERSRGVTYPPALWNLYERTLSGESRTNNSMEGWHSSIRRCFAGKPQMTTLLTRIKSEQEYAMQSLREFRINPSRGLRQRPQRYRYRLQNDQFMEIVSRWGEKDGNRCVEYLRRLALHSQSLHPSNTDPGEDCDDDAENAQDTSVEAT